MRYNDIAMSLNIEHRSFFLFLLSLGDFNHEMWFLRPEPWRETM